MSYANQRRVVVTGLGLISPVGCDVETGWNNIKEGKSGIKPITHMEIEPFSVHFGGPIYDFPLEDYISKKDAKKMDPYGIGMIGRIFPRFSVGYRGTMPRSQS